MEIVPIMQRYDCEINNHAMIAVVEHKENSRDVEYYFDDKLVGKKELPEESFFTDDDCITDIVENYSKNNTGIYADIFQHHKDKVFLISKQLHVKVIDFGIVIDVNMKVEKDFYSMDLSTENGENHIVCKFKANNFSDVLEKMRIFTGMLSDVSGDLAKNIDLLANDKVKEKISWKA